MYTDGKSQGPENIIIIEKSEKKENKMCVLKIIRNRHLPIRCESHTERVRERDEWTEKKTWQQQQQQPNSTHIMCIKICFSDGFTSWK